jgi:cytochrome c oxidase subunit 2
MTDARRAAPWPALALAATIAVLAACGGGDADPPALGPAAAEGRKVANSKGCAACHGTRGQGAVGPAFAGLFGSEVELENGTTVIADEDYIVESITDPSAKRVAGYSIPMPQSRFADGEVAALVAYIRELGPPATETGSP